MIMCHTMEVDVLLHVTGMVLKLTRRCYSTMERSSERSENIDKVNSENFNE